MSTTIAWVRNPANKPGSGETLNVATGCGHESQGCLHCYAERLAATRLKHQPAYKGLTRHGRWTGKVRINEKLIEKPLHWKKPRGIFWCDMGDLLHPGVPFEFIDKCMAVVAMTPQHRHFILTKRAERMAEHMVSRSYAGMADMPILHAAAQIDERFAAANQDMEWPFHNLWLGVTAETPLEYNERVPHLRRCPAAVRFVSMEPMLSKIVLDLTGVSWLIIGCEQLGGRRVGRLGLNDSGTMRYLALRKRWLGWLRDIIEQCKAAGVACFVKQIPDENSKVSHDPETWPAWMRVRQWPTK